MGILDSLLLVAAAVGGMTTHATLAQHYDRTGMGAVYGYSYNGGYRGLNVALGFGKGGISATGGIYGGRRHGGGTVAEGGYYTDTAVASQGAAGGYGPGGGGGGFDTGYGASGYGERFAYDSGYGQQWRRRHGHRERFGHRALPRRFSTYDYDYGGGYQYRRGRRFNNYKNDYYDY